MLREAGAREVHVRIASPPIKWPCFYGIDFATRAELIANGLSTDEIRRSVDADSLGYVSLDELVAATEVPEERLCRACFDGVYPVALPDQELLGENLLEGDDAWTEAWDDAWTGDDAAGERAVPVSDDHPDGVAALTGGAGAGDSLSRP
jgi:amidophosphoribosyltransferase